MSASDIRFYVDTLIVETIVGNTSLVKSADDTGGMLSGLAPMIQEYVGAHIDQNDKAGSIIDMLAPAGLFSIFRLLGHPILGLLAGAAASALHIDIAGMIEVILKEVKSTLSSGQKVVPSQIDNAVSQAVQQYAPQGEDQSPADDTMENSVAQDLRYARMLRLSLEQYDRQLFRLTKQAIPAQQIFAYAIGRGARNTSYLGRILGWIFKVFLWSAGFMLLGDVANKMLGRPNALSGNYQAGSPQTASPAAVPVPVTTQTKFSIINPSSQNTPAPQPWAENVTNDASSIENMLVNFTKDVYAGLDGKESAIQSSPTFQAVRDQIVWYNHAAAGEPKVYLPSMYANKKAIVDHYIDEVAKASV
jgi:hypothetical protein